MSRPWTHNQKLAINAREGSLLVSAAAGSGKTAVLVERVIRMVTDSSSPVPIDRLLIVTYTRAAAQELKDRISSALSNLITQNPANPWYRRQLMYLPSANISTVDSFCSDLVREFFQHLEISSDYRIADNGELTVIKQEAMERTLEYFYSQKDSVFLSLVESFATVRDDSRLQSNILRMYEFLRSHPFGSKWLNEKLSYYTDFTTVSESVWGHIVLDYALSACDYCIDLTENSLRLLEQEVELQSKVIDLFMTDLQYFTSLKEKMSNCTWDEILTYIDAFVVGRMNARGFTEHPIKLRVAANRDIVKDTYKSIRALFEQNEAEISSDIRYQQPLISKLFECIQVFDKHYSEIKLQKNVADFSDVEHYALNLLVKCDNDGEISETEIATLVSDRFDMVMVDEYQDANEVQDLIFNSVSHSGSNLFVVGDVKQSIYGFRQAMPEIFLGRKNSLPLFDCDAQNYPAKVILEQNFRSRKQVTDFVNFTFRELMSIETGDLEYNSEEELVCGAKYNDTAAPCNELHLLDLDEIGDIDASVAEARHIASVIHSKCKDTYVKDGDGERLAVFGDFAILMRNKSRYGEIYATELRRCGIPAVCESSGGFLSSFDVNVAVNFLRVIDNPVQDIPILSVMMSPVYGFTPDDLARIRSNNKKTSLYMSVRKYADQGDKKAQKFLSDIDYLRNLSIIYPADVFIGLMYEHTGLVSLLKASDGEIAQNNLRLLIEYAAAFEQGASKGISAFVSYLDKLQRSGTDLPAASVTNTDNKDAVRIMTIHASKGLEFPICIVANTARQFSSDAKDNVLLHSKLGFASKRRDEILMCSYNTLPREAVSLEIKRSEKSEELRVLYVAMTRAKEQLIMVASKKKLRSYTSKLASLLAGDDHISPFIVRDCTYLSDWLVLCGLMHPDGSLLRSYAGMEAPDTFPDSSAGNLSVQIITYLDSLESLPLVRLSNRTSFEDVPENIYSTLCSRFDYKGYKYTELSKIPQKVTASELAHKETAVKFGRILAKPAFMSDSPLTPAERGTAMHSFLEYCDFISARQNVESEISRLVLKSRLTQKQADSLNRALISSFVNSSIVSRALSANEYFREYRFTVNIPASSVDENISEEFKNCDVILQGSVDLAIVEDDGIIIVDYKTDRVSSTDELVSMYSKQLKLYKQAVEQTMDKKVKSCLIYSVNLSESTEVLL